MRLEYGDKVYGLMSASVPKYLAADEKEQGLFEEVVKDVAFSLHSIKLEEEHKRADEVLSESEQRFRDLVENSLTGVSIIQDDRIVFQNREPGVLKEHRFSCGSHRWIYDRIKCPMP